MDVAYINAFVKAIENVFATMLSTNVQVMEPSLKSGDDSPYDVSGIIGISGDVTGVIVLSFPREVAERVASLFTGASLSADTDDFSDAIGELVNMISGNAKAKFEGKKTSISCPTVVVGNSHQVLRQRDIPSIQMPCSCDCGDFVLEVSLRDGAAPVQVCAEPSA